MFNEIDMQTDKMTIMSRLLPPAFHSPVLVIISIRFSEIFKRTSEENVDKCVNRFPSIPLKESDKDQL